MAAARTWIRSHLPIVALWVALALAVRLLVPAGFMPAQHGGRVVAALCDGRGGSSVSLVIPRAEDKAGGAAASGSCAFADLALSAAGTADLAPLPAPPVFGTVAGPILAKPAAARGALRLWPPLRGPPATA